MNSSKLTKQEKKEKLLAARAKVKYWCSKTYNSKISKSSKGKRSNTSYPNYSKPHISHENVPPDSLKESNKKQALQVAWKELETKKAQLEIAIQLIKKKIQSLS